MIKKLQKKNLPFILILSVLLALLVEIWGFQADKLIMKAKGIQPTSLDLSALPDYDGTGIPVSAETGTYSFDNLNLPVHNVEITLSGTPDVVRGTISLCDDASMYRTTGGGQFLANPGGSANTFRTRINSHGNLTRLRISFIDQTDPIKITAVTFNQSALLVSPLRILIFALLAAGILLTLKYRPYTETLDMEKRSHRFLSLGMLAVCLAFSLAILIVGNPERVFLKPLPSEAELRSYAHPSLDQQDAYAEQLDAFEKGQLNLDLSVNPALLTMPDPYDKGARDKLGVSCRWDRALYNGSYYSYFGLAPLFTVYYPVYLLTHKLPAELLTLTILCMFALITSYSALHALMRFFRIRANLLLYLLGFPAAAVAGMLFLFQSNPSFYYFPVLSALGWLSLFLTFAFNGCRLWQEQKQGRKCSLLFLGAGISVVMIVLSRPTILLIAAAFVIPAFLRILFSKESSLRQKAAVVLPFLIPILIGGIGICWYNYARFGSILEFGAKYQLTESDIRYNHVALSFHHFKAMLYHYFLEPLNYQEFFPFVHFLWTPCFDFGNYLYYECNAGLFNFPLNLGILLLGWTCHSGSETSVSRTESSLKKRTYIFVAAGILLLCYLDFCVGGIHFRYTGDAALSLSLLSLLLIFEHVSYSNVKSGRILYALNIAVILLTLLVGFLLLYTGEKDLLTLKNPDFYVNTARLFRNW